MAARAARLKYGRMNPEKAMERYAAGDTDTEIAEHIGCSASSVSKWRQDNGLSPNAPRVKAPSSRKWDRMDHLARDAYAAWTLGITYGQFKAQYPKGITYDELKGMIR